MGKIRKWKGPGRKDPYAQKSPQKSLFTISLTRALSLRSVSASVAVPSLKSSWAKRQQDRADRAALLVAQKEIDETIRAEKRAEREQREAKEKKKQENRERGQKVQVITNTAKIKKMSKKQLRMIKKADTSGVAPKVYGKGVS